MDNSPRFYNLEKVNSLFKYFFFLCLNSLFILPILFPLKFYRLKKSTQPLKRISYFPQLWKNNNKKVPPTPMPSNSNHPFLLCKIQLLSKTPSQAKPQPQPKIQLKTQRKKQPKVPNSYTLHLSV